MWYESEEQRTAVIKAIRAGLSESAIKYQFSLTEEQLLLAVEDFKVQKIDRDKQKELFGIVDSRNLESEETLRRLKAQADSLGTVTPERLGEEIAIFTLSIIQQSKLLRAETVVEAGILIGVAEKASKVLNNLYGDDSADTSSFEDFSKKLKA